MNFSIAGIVISLMSILTTMYLVPFLKQKLKKENLDTINFWVYTIVNSVEQMPEFRDKSGEEKKAYVIRFLKEKGIAIAENDLNMLIESSVKIMNNLKNES